MSKNHTDALYTQAIQYRLSGGLGNSLLFLPLALPIAAALGAACGYAIAYNSYSGVLSLAIAAVFGVGLGFALSYILLAAHCRAQGFGLIASAVGAGFMIYCGFVAFVYVISTRHGDLPAGQTLFGLFAAPGEWWQSLVEISRRGWQSRAPQLTGLSAWGSWAGVTLLVVTLTVATVNEFLSRMVFCESCARWCPRLREGAAYLQPPADPAALERLRQGDLTPLAALPAAKPGAVPALRVDIQECDRCWDFIVLSLNEMVEKQLGRDRSRPVARLIGKHLIVSKNLRDQLAEKNRSGATFIDTL